MSGSDIQAQEFFELGLDFFYYISIIFTMKEISFTEGELRALMQLLDIAVKAGGLQVSEAAVVLAQKCQTALGPPSVEEQDIQRSEGIADTSRIETPEEQESSVA